jgi:hypothetical protein
MNSETVLEAPTSTILTAKCIHLSYSTQLTQSRGDCVTMVKLIFVPILVKMRSTIFLMRNNDKFSVLVLGTYNQNIATRLTAPGKRAQLPMFIQFVGPLIVSAAFGVPNWSAE